MTDFTQIVRDGEITLTERAEERRWCSEVGAWVVDGVVADCGHWVQDRDCPGCFLGGTAHEPCPGCK